MAKHIKACELEDFPDEYDLQFGRNWVRENYTRSESYDIMQYKFWRDYLRSLAMSCFEWVNMPEGIDTRAVEYILLMYHTGCIFEEDGGKLFAQSAPGDQINMYWNPNKVMLYAPNGFSWVRHCQPWVFTDENGEAHLMERDAVQCWDNLLRMPLDRYIQWYAKRIATIDRIMDVNMGAQRTPYIVYGSEESKRTREKAIKRLLANDQYIQMNDTGVVGGMIDVLPTQAPYVADKLAENKARIINEALTLVGIDNTNNEKKERMIDAEATSNNEQIMTLRRSRLEARRSFCEAYNIWAEPEYPLECKWGIPHLTDHLDTVKSSMFSNNESQFSAEPNQGVE